MTNQQIMQSLTEARRIVMIAIGQHPEDQYWLSHV